MIFGIFESGSTTTILAELIGCIIALIIAMTIHEFAHAFAAVKSGDPTPKMTGRLTLNPLAHMDPMGTLLLLIAGFGFARPVQINPNNFKNYKKGMLQTSAAGVLANIILGFISSLFLLVAIKFIQSENFFAQFLIAFLSYLVLYNISLCVFNLLPIFPLDGFNIIFAFSKKKAQLMKFMMQYGTYLLLLILCISAAFDFIPYITGKISLGFIKFWQLIFGGLL